MTEQESVKTKKTSPTSCAKYWERNRRQKWRSTVQTLAKLLPSYDPALPLSQLQTLNKAILYIEELKTQNNLFQNGGKDGVFKEKIEKLKRRVKELIQRIDQLTDLLRSANIKLPPLVTYPSLNVPNKPLSAKPKWIARVPYKLTEKLTSTTTQVVIVADKRMTERKQTVHRERKIRKKESKRVKSVKKVTTVQVVKDKKFTEVDSPSQTKENTPVDFNTQETSAQQHSNNTSISLDKLYSLTSSIQVTMSECGQKMKQTLPKTVMVTQPNPVIQQPVQPPPHSLIQPTNTYILTNDGNLVPCYQSQVINPPTQNVLTPVIINRTPPLLVLQKPPVIQTAQIVNTNQVFSIPKPVQILSNEVTKSIPVKNNLPVIMAKPPPAKKRILKDTTVTTFVNKVPITALSKQSYSNKKVNSISKTNKTSKKSDKCLNNIVADRSEASVTNKRKLEQQVTGCEKKMKGNEENQFKPIKETEVVPSLKIPTSEKQSSVSPTAAFLSIFPIVASSKADEEVEDEGNKEVVCKEKDSKGTQTTRAGEGNVESETQAVGVVTERQEQSKSTMSMLLTKLDTWTGENSTKGKQDVWCEQAGKTNQATQVAGDKGNWTSDCKTSQFVQCGTPGGSYKVQGVSKTTQSQDGAETHKDNWIDQAHQAVTWTPGQIELRNDGLKSTWNSSNSSTVSTTTNVNKHIWSGESFGAQGKVQATSIIHDCSVQKQMWSESGALCTTVPTLAKVPTTNTNECAGPKQMWSESVTLRTTVSNINSTEATAHSKVPALSTNECAVPKQMWSENVVLCIAGPTLNPTEATAHNKVRTADTNECVVQKQMWSENDTQCTAVPTLNSTEATAHNKVRTANTNECAVQKQIWSENVTLCAAVPTINSTEATAHSKLPTPNTNECAVQKQLWSENVALCTAVPTLNSTEATAHSKVPTTTTNDCTTQKQIWSSAQGRLPGVSHSDVTDKDKGWSTQPSFATAQHLTMNLLECSGQKESWPNEQPTDKQHSSVQKLSWVDTHLSSNKNCVKEPWIDKQTNQVQVQKESAVIGVVDSKQMTVEGAKGWNDNQTVDKVRIKHTHSECGKQSGKVDTGQAPQLQVETWSELTSSADVKSGQNVNKNLEQHNTWEPTYPPELYSNNFCLPQAEFTKPHNCEHFTFKNNFPPPDVSNKMNHKFFPPPTFDNKLNNKITNKNYQLTPTSSEPRNMRPPVNWMTGPDIRSAAMQNNPSFGVNSNMARFTDNFNNNNNQKTYTNSQYNKTHETNLNLFDYNNQSSGAYYELDKSQYCHNQAYTKNKTRQKKKQEVETFTEEGKKKTQIEQFTTLPSQDCWTPIKNVDWAPNSFIVPSTLPTLVGDLALGTTITTAAKSTDKTNEINKNEVTLDQTNLSRNIFDVTNNNNNETIVLKNIFELPPVAKPDLFNKDKIQYTSQTSRKTRIQNQTNSFLSVSQLVETQNSYDIMKNDEDINTYTSFNNNNVKQYKNKTRNNFNNKNDRKYNYKTNSNNYTAEALIRPDTETLPNISYFNNKPKPELESKDVSQIIHSTTQNTYTDFNYSSPVANFNLAANISCSLNNDFLSQHETTFQHQNNFLTDFISDYPETVQNTLLLPCSSLQNPFLQDKRIEYKTKRNSKKKYDCVKTQTDTFTNTTTSNNKNIKSLYTTPFSSTTISTNSYQNKTNLLPTVPTSFPTFPATTNNIHSPFTNTPQCSVPPFLTLTSTTPSVPTHSSSNSLANFNLSTIFPEINQKVNFHYS